MLQETKKKNESEFRSVECVSSAQELGYNSKYDGEMQEVLDRRMSHECKNPSDFTGRNELQRSKKGGDGEKGVSYKVLPITEGRNNGVLDIRGINGVDETSVQAIS